MTFELKSLNFTKHFPWTISVRCFCDWRCYIRVDLKYVFIREIQKIYPRFLLTGIGAHLNWNPFETPAPHIMPQCMSRIRFYMPKNLNSAHKHLSHFSLAWGGPYLRFRFFMVDACLEWFLSWKNFNYLISIINVFCSYNLNTEKNVVYRESYLLLPSLGSKCKNNVKDSHDKCICSVNNWF